MRITALLAFAAALPWIIAMVALCHRRPQRRVPVLVHCALHAKSAGTTAGTARRPAGHRSPSIHRNRSQRCAMPHIATAR